MGDYCRYILEVEIPVLDWTVFGRTPLPVFNEGDYKKVAEKQTNSEKKWKGNNVLPFCTTSSSAQEQRLFVVFALKKPGVTSAGTQTYEHRLPTNVHLF